jgi:hypothetical protein
MFSVLGLYGGAVTDGMLVAVKGVGTVVVVITPNTRVDAGGLSLQGSTTACHLGDQVFAFTQPDGLGRRVAWRVIANLTTYWAIVSAIRGSILVCNMARYGAHSWGNSVEIVLTSSTVLEPRPPSVGDYVYVMASASSHTNPADIWAIVVSSPAS